MTHRALRVGELDAALDFLLNKALEEFPDNIERAVKLAEYLKQGLFPFLKHAIRALPSSIASNENVESSHIHLEAGKLWGQNIPNESSAFKFITNPHFEAQLNTIVRWLANVVRHPEAYV